MTTETRASPLTWTILWLIALAGRLTAAWFLPNAEQDAYSYVEEIAVLTTKLGHLHPSDLFGFWLPLFQLTAAIPNAWIDNPLMAGKILSALAGAASCVLVFAITLKLTRNIFLAGAAFALVLCNPFHILYSAASMTDVPHACLVLACLWFFLQERWVLAAVVAALAEGARLEAWTLAIVLPVAQFAWQRRISIPAVIVLLLPPLTWFAICFFATGNPLAYFAKRAAYHANYLDFYSSRRVFTLADIQQDAGHLLLGANAVALFAIVAASGLSIFHMFARSSRRYWPVATMALCAVTMFSFLFVAYVTKRQPVILPRYGLIFFLLGLPLLAWLLQLLFENWPKSRFPRIITALVLALCLWPSLGQLPTIGKVLDDFRAQQQIANQVAAMLLESVDADARCFSDDPAVRVLSQLPAGRFVRSETTPLAAGKNAEAFKSYLQQGRILWLVFVRVENSLPVKFFPELGRDARIDIANFQFISVAVSPFGPDVWLYRVRNSD